MIRVKESYNGARNGQHTREFTLIEDNAEKARMTMRLTHSGIIIDAPDNALPPQLYEILVRSVIAAAANTGLKMITENMNYCAYGFKKNGDFYTAESKDIDFPRLCKKEGI